MKKVLAMLLTLSLLLTACAACFAEEADDAAITGDGTLREGSKNASVALLQTALKAAGYYDDMIDGDFGPVTKAAVEKAQEDLSLPVTGEIREEPVLAYILESVDSLFNYIGLEKPDDELLAEFLFDLLTAELTDDDQFDDYALAVWIADALINGGSTPEEIAKMVYILALYDADAEADDYDFAADIALLTYLDDGSGYFDTYLNNALRFLEDLYGEEFRDNGLIIQDLLMADLLDDDDLTDADIVLRIVNSFYMEKYRSWDIGKELILLALVDAMDNDNADDIELIDEYAKLALTEDEYRDTLQSIQNAIELLTNSETDGEFDKADSMLMKLAIQDLLDDNNITDYLTIIDVIDAIIEDDEETYHALLYSLPIIEFYDDYDNSDVALALEYLKTLEEIEGAGSYDADAVSKALEQIGYEAE